MKSEIKQRQTFSCQLLPCKQNLKVTQKYISTHMFPSWVKKFVFLFYSKEKKTLIFCGLRQGKLKYKTKQKKKKGKKKSFSQLTWAWSRQCYLDLKTDFLNPSRYSLLSNRKKYLETIRKRTWQTAAIEFCFEKAKGDRIIFWNNLWK